MMGSIKSYMGLFISFTVYSLGISLLEFVKRVICFLTKGNHSGKKTKIKVKATKETQIESNDENCGKSLDTQSKLEYDVSRLEEKNTRVESRVAWIEKKLSELQEKKVDEQMIRKQVASRIPRLQPKP